MPKMVSIFEIHRRDKSGKVEVIKPKTGFTASDTEREEYLRLSAAVDAAPEQQPAAAEPPKKAKKADAPKTEPAKTEPAKTEAAKTEAGEGKGEPGKGEPGATEDDDLV